MQPQVSAIILAAGMSVRMGRHKLLLDTGGVPMIRRTVLAVLNIEPVETIVVTGFGEADIRDALADLPLRFAHNPHYESGQPGSVATGVRMLTQFCHAVMVVPGDQPLLTGPDLASLITAYTRTDRSILVPFHDGQRGNPIMFAAAYGPDVTAGGLNIGCRHLIDSKPDEVARVEFFSDVFTFDCDTPADYAALTVRLAERRHLDAEDFAGSARP